MQLPVKEWLRTVSGKIIRSLYQDILKIIYNLWTLNLTSGKRFELYCREVWPGLAAAIPIPDAL